MEAVTQHEDKSKAWLDWRNKGLGSSDCPVIMNVSPWCTAKQLWKYKTGLEIRSQESNFAIDKGNRLEPIARRKFAAIYNLLFNKNETFEAKLFEMEDLPFMRSSLDGISHDNKISIEIKYLGREAFYQVKDGVVPQKYFPQIQQQMLVSGAEKAYLVGINDDDGPVNYCEVKRDEEYMALLIRQCSIFWDCVQKKEWPFPGENLPLEVVKPVAVENVDYKALFQERDQIDEEIAKLSARKLSIEATLLKAANGSEIVAGNFKLSYVTRVGAVDYSKIPQLQGVELDQYRKPSSTYPKFGKVK